MTPIKCIAIEDEPPALQLLEHYARQVPFLYWIQGFRQPLDALPLLNGRQADLIFLDINMPQMNGLSFYRSLPSKPLVIFTTAYPEYAAESYTMEAVDYLVKPIQFDRFIQACNKAQRIIPAQETKLQEKDSLQTLYLKSGSKWFPLHWPEVNYLEKSENYVIFYTADGRKILSRQNMSDVEQIMPSFFVRIHKSYIVNIKCIDVIEREQVQVTKTWLPLADTYRNGFMEKLNL